MQTLIDFARTGAAGGNAPVRCAFGAPSQTLVAHTPAQVRPLLDAVQALARQGRWCVGYLRYEAGAAFDSALAVHEADGPLAWFGVHDTPQPWPEGEAGGIATAQWHESLTRTAFDQGMAEIHRAVADGELYQLNYTAPLHGVMQGAPCDLFMALRRAQPGGYAAYIDTGDEQVLSVSPELFFDWDGERILARPMKGTAPRGATPEDDAALAAQLRASAKERAENVMIVDLIRNDLSRVGQPFSVRVPHLFRLEALPSVWQMTSDVEARTRAGTTLADVFAALFPCGSITGAPKVRAMQMIKSLEPDPRGVYCGAVGVVRPGGAATFNVAIRTVTVKGGAVRCGIGSGITADATADGEWQEWRHKRAFLERASQPFELLETLALQDGVLRNAPDHLARLARAAVHFGYPLDVARVEVSLQQLADAHRQGLWRVRLLLNARGQAQVEAHAMEASPALVQLALASTAFEEAGSEFVRFKTTRRAHYDAFAPRVPGAFDTLLWNRQGELTECTRGNVAVQLDGRWVTPPLRCGLLDGIGRARFLREGRLVEAVVRVEDLPCATGLAFVNSLRGWIDAVLV
ncbi:aminodeoxychorismate synthase component I [Rhodoferax ferrireducens]|uniref:aminodeoxychorismate synthase component I n=1 Tax=Rhodoferax ferrireducens TaxID=192843 RepID=UPI000E0DF8E9|nr:aminodeoxychorismate synthase component I [Rhodoferax ferrireducens]